VGIVRLSQKGRNNQKFLFISNFQFLNLAKMKISSIAVLLLGVGIQLSNAIFFSVGWGKPIASGYGWGGGGDAWGWDGGASSSGGDGGWGWEAPPAQEGWGWAPPKVTETHKHVYKVHNYDTHEHKVHHHDHHEHKVGTFYNGAT